MPHKTFFNWSSGKDSALALHYLMQNKTFHVDKLVTTVNGYHNRVSMHGLSTHMLEQQLTALNMPLDLITLPEKPSMEVYEAAIEDYVSKAKRENYTHCAFGDIFLEDLKVYREKQMEALGLKTVFPLWKQDTHFLLEDFLTKGFKAVIICIDATLLDQSFLGRVIDKDFIHDLPPTVDPCGEHGEFHTFCFDGPIFQFPITYKIGDHVFKEYQNPNRDKQHDNEQTKGFWFCDLLPSNAL